MTLELSTKDKATAVAKILSGIKPLAKFTYTDKKGKVTERCVEVSSFFPDADGNFVWYSYADDKGHGGGTRSFKGSRIKDFVLID